MAQGQRQDRGGRRQRPSCYDKACELLARRSHFVSELRQKLVVRQYPEADVASALARLSEQGLLDDLELARRFVERRRRDLGRRRLASELQRHGAPDEAIREALEGVDDEADLASARLAADRWRGGRGGDKAALARHLERKGFGSRAILVILSERASAPDPGERAED